VEWSLDWQDGIDALRGGRGLAQPRCEGVLHDRQAQRLLAAIIRFSFDEESLS
jgi:hypothetical protein